MSDSEVCCEKLLRLLTRAELHGPEITSPPVHENVILGNVLVDCGVVRLEQVLFDGRAVHARYVKACRARSAGSVDNAPSVGGPASSSIVPLVRQPNHRAAPELVRPYIITPVGGPHYKMSTIGRKTNIHKIVAPGVQELAPVVIANPYQLSKVHLRRAWNEDERTVVGDGEVTDPDGVRGQHTPRDHHRDTRELNRFHIEGRRQDLAVAREDQMSAGRVDRTRSTLDQYFPIPALRG